MSPTPLADDARASRPIDWHGPAPGLTRRRALQLMAASLALAEGACSEPPRERIHAWVDLPELRAGGLPLYYASAFVRDGYAQGVLIGTREGRPIKIEGNPRHPASLGATDVWAQASVLQLWDPDRSSTVVERLGDRAAPASESASASGSTSASASASASTQPAPAAASTWAAFQAAWSERGRARDETRGAGLHILTGPVTSPTLRAQLAALLDRWPAARWHVHAPLTDDSATQGGRLAYRRAVASILHFDRARVVVAFDADPFSHHPGAVRHAADWAKRRVNGAATQVIALETTPGLFGVRADERVALPPARIEAVLWQVGAALLGDQAAPAADPGEAALVERIARALRGGGSESLIVPGPTVSAAAHALVHRLHRRLGSVGRTVDLIEPPDAGGDAGSIAELAEAMHAGAVDTLLVLGRNPVYDAPAGLGFAAALDKVPFSVHLGLYRDETAQRCRWHLPQSHDYEQWSDARAFDGTATLLQPAIAPLYDSRAAHELIAALLADGTPGGHELVRRQWSKTSGDFETFWRESLRRGFVEGSAYPPLELPEPQASVASPPTPRREELELVFVADPSVHDGHFANNAWLQELPRPFSKITWDNALQIGPATARRLGVGDGDVVRLQVSGQRLEAPVWVQASHAEGAASLPLGYGRRQAGRVGNGVGVDAYRLRMGESRVARVQVERTAASHAFARVQHEMAQHGRDLARVLGAGQTIGDRGSQHASLYPQWPRGEHAWGMVIDLDTCVGCNACTIACQAENNIPVVGKEQVALGREMHWIRVDRYASDELPGDNVFQPVPCMHCEKAPCELVCPVGATMHDSDGLNVQVYNRCVGTRFCSNNCPYKVRRFNFLLYSDWTTETLKGQRNPDVTVRQRGVMEKCTYCLQRITRARQHAEAG